MRFEGSQLWDNPIWREARDQSVRNGIARRTIWIWICFLSWTGISLDELLWKLLPSISTAIAWGISPENVYSTLLKNNQNRNLQFSPKKNVQYRSIVFAICRCWFPFGIEWHHNSHSWAVIVWCVVSTGSMVTPTRTPRQNMAFPVDCPFCYSSGTRWIKNVPYRSHSTKHVVEWMLHVRPKVSKYGVP